MAAPSSGICNARHPRSFRHMHHRPHITPSCATDTLPPISDSWISLHACFPCTRFQEVWQCGGASWQGRGGGVACFVCCCSVRHPQPPCSMHHQPHPPATTSASSCRERWLVYDLVFVISHTHTHLNTLNPRSCSPCQRLLSATCRVPQPSSAALLQAPTPLMTCPASCQRCVEWRLSGGWVAVGRQLGCSWLLAVWFPSDMST